MSDRDTPRERYQIGTHRICEGCGQRLIRLVIEPDHRPADVDALRAEAGYWPVEMLVHPTAERAEFFAGLVAEPAPPGREVYMVEAAPPVLFLAKGDPRQLERDGQALAFGWSLTYMGIATGELRRGHAPLTTQTAAELWEILDALQPPAG